MKSHKDLLVWQKSMDLAKNIYLLTKKLPNSELYNLVAQIQRCSVSIPSNIAEGSKRNHTAEYIQFLAIANGSASELETQLLLIQRIYPELSSDCEGLITKTEEILKMLHSLISYLRTPKQTTDN